jgi:hypothetical protein
MPKDRTRRRVLAPDVEIVVERSSTKPVEYAIMLIVRRDGIWQTICTFDNAHDPTEHHEHRYIGTEKQAPTTFVGTANDAMAKAERELLSEWPSIVSEWEATR